MTGGFPDGGAAAALERLAASMNIVTPAVTQIGDRLDDVLPFDGAGAAGGLPFKAVWTIDDFAGLEGEAFVHGASRALRIRRASEAEIQDFARTKQKSGDRLRFLLELDGQSKHGRNGARLRVTAAVRFLRLASRIFPSAWRLAGGAR